MSKVNKIELGNILGLSQTTLTEYQAEGLPISVRGARGQENHYDSAEVIQWLIQRALARAGRSKAVLEIELLEFQVKAERAKDALREKTLVNVAEIEPLWTSYVLTAAAFMAGRHSRLAGLLEAAPGMEAKRALLKKEDTEFLSKLGMDGERMQGELDALLTSLGAENAKAFLQRVAGSPEG